MAFRTEDYLQSIVRELTKLPFETEWAEFKCNTKDPERTAKYISGLSNSAKLCDKPFAYLAWGIDDSTHKIVGTSFNYHLSKKGNEELDKVVDSTCKNCLIAPLVENQNNQFTKVVLFKKVPFEIITKEDRIRTCYMLACLAYINFSAISNSDVRRTFGLEDNKVKASRIIKDTLKANRIKLVDEKASDKNKRYVPMWA